MKKLLLSLLVSVISYSYADNLTLNVSGNFYAFIDNQSTNIKVSVWQQNPNPFWWWDNKGWCDGANDYSTPLDIAPGMIRAYCGGTTTTSTTALFVHNETNHQWWFKRDKEDWVQPYGDIWDAETNYTPMGRLIVMTDIHSSSGGYDTLFKREEYETTPPMSDHIIAPRHLTLRKDLVVIYTMRQDGVMVAECYTYPQYTVSFSGGSNDVRRAYLTWLRANAKNLCSGRNFNIYSR